MLSLLLAATLAQNAIAITNAAAQIDAAIVAKGGSTTGGLLAAPAGIASIPSGEPDPTAADYIHDGLVWLYDARENVGYGQHDSTSRTWVNLVDSTLNISLNNDATWDDYKINRLAVSVPYTWGSWVTNPGATIEVAYYFAKPFADNGKLFYTKSAENYDSIKIFSTWTPTYSTYLQLGRFLQGSDVRWRNNFFGNQGNPFCCTQFAGVINTNSYSKSVMGVNGQVMWIDNTDTSHYYYPIGTSTKLGETSNQNETIYFCCVRVYSRPLSAEELIHNYEIDKKRFFNNILQ